MSEPALTIVMPVYNKEKYIAEALDSVFGQKTDRAFRIVIADDCSTDRSLEVVSRYEKAHPGVIEVLRSDRNLKLFRNVVRAYAELKTDYFCVLDPDDYWTDERKIDRALDFLEKHREYTVFATDNLVLSPDGSARKFCGRETPCDSTFGDFLEGKAVTGNTLGSVFRNVVFREGVPRRLLGLSAAEERYYRGDTFRTVIHLERGKVHFEPVCDAVYRVTSDGLWQGTTAFRQKLDSAEFFLEMDSYFDGRYPGFRRLAAFGAARIVRDWRQLVVREPDAGSLGECVRRLERLEAEIGTEVGLRAPEGLKEKLRLWLYRRLRRKLLRRGLV